MLRRLRILVFVSISLLIINGLARSILRNLKNARRISDLRQEVGGMEQRNAELRGEVEYRQSGGYVEREARERLGYVKEGETVLILPDTGQEGSRPPSSGAEGTGGRSRAEKPPLEQWKEVFFGAGY